jgi:creatinine amidohydrolase/Fe(II)-dependent formamide hydrolase-like protein
VRIAGPLCGLAAAFGVARALARSLGSESALEQASPDAVAARIAAAESLLDAALSDLPADALARRFVLLATGGYAALASNLKQKILEGLLRPLPPAFDVLEFAHGPFQQCFEDSVCFLALLRDDAPDEPLWMERLQGMLEPSRHALLPLRATLPGLYALFEHEAWLDALVLRRLETENPDPARWPGRGRDAPLYRAAPQAPAAPAPAPPVRAAPVELGSAVWPELETALAGGACAVVPLGAIEQHGPHLPFATDTWIADALAVRLCARLPGCVALPAVSLGCSPEHADFPGTLALRAETLEAVLADAIVSLARHGVSRVFVFSAHGGNAEALRAALPRLREAACDAARECGHAAPRVLAHTDLAGLTRALHRAAADQGVGPGEAGHHAGEIETSILLALRPGAVRREAFAPGTLAPQPDAQALFHPSLRARAPSGTVGDPRRADAARGARYLEAWTDVLVACIREGEAP